MGNWLENLMHKMNEEEIKQRIIEAKKQEIDRSEREKEMSKREEIKKGLRDILVKYKVPSLLADVKDTVWKEGEIVEESRVTGPEKFGWFDPDPPEIFCWFAMALAHKKGGVHSGKVTVMAEPPQSQNSSRDVMYTYVDAVIIGVKARRDKSSRLPFSPDSLYFKSGSFAMEVDSEFAQFSPGDRKKMKVQLHPCVLITEKLSEVNYLYIPTISPLVTIGINGRRGSDSDSHVISKLQDLLAKDSFSRKQGGRAS